MSASFYNADRRTHRRIMLVGLMFCAAFVAISYFAKPQPESHSLFLKADNLVRTAGNPPSANCTDYIRSVSRLLPMLRDARVARSSA